MTHALMVMALLAAPTVPLPDEKETPGPKGPPPQVMVVAGDQDGKVYIEVTATRTVPENRDVEVKVGNRLEKRTYTVMVTVVEKKALSLDSKDIKVFDTEGKRIDAKDLPKLVRKKAPALVSADGKEVDPFYLKLAAKGTLVIVMPPAQPVVMPPSDAAPVLVPPPPRPKD